MKAIVGAGPDGYRMDENFKLPPPSPTSILVQVHAVALNPRDEKIVGINAAPGSLAGCDFSGTVMAVGESVTRFKAGDRVLAVTFGSNPSDKTKGAFGELALAEEDFTCHVPESLTFPQACSMGLAVATAGLALFRALELIPSMEQGAEEMVLVSGGATATGTMATQLLKAAGYNPIVTCSPVNNDLCKSYGASACVDYHSPSCGADIRVYTDNSLRYVLDCVTDDDTMKMCYEAMGASGGRYVALGPIAVDVKYTRRDICASWILADTITGEDIQMSGIYGRPPTPEYRQFGRELFVRVEQLLREEKIISHPIEVVDGGLENLPRVIAEMKKEKVRAKKLVMPVRGILKGN